MVSSAPRHPHTPPHTPILQTSTLTLVRTTCLATEIILSSFALPTSLTVATIHPGTVGERVQAGMEAPGELVKLLAHLPQELREMERLVHVLEMEWSLERVQAILDIGKTAIPRIAKKEMERIRWAIVGIQNIQRFPLETVETLLSVALIYAILIFWIDFIRLGDRDSVWSGVRKRMWRQFFRTSSDVTILQKRIEDLWGGPISPEELRKIFELGIEELKRRKGLGE